MLTYLDGGLQVPRVILLCVSVDVVKLFAAVAIWAGEAGEDAVPVQVVADKVVDAGEAGGAQGALLIAGFPAPTADRGAFQTRFADKICRNKAVRKLPIKRKLYTLTRFVSMVRNVVPPQEKLEGERLGAEHAAHGAPPFEDLVMVMLLSVKIRPVVGFLGRGRQILLLSRDTSFNGPRGSVLDGGYIRCNLFLFPSLWTFLNPTKKDTDTYSDSHAANYICW